VIDDLYSARLLALAANLPHAGRLPRPDATAERTSKLCGSRVVVDVVLRDGRVAEFAQDVQACALGQASAGVLGEAVVGATPQELEAARDALAAMLREGAPPPAGRFAALAALAPVRDYPARHASTRLAFEAAAAAAREAARAEA
jgi:NifU-like protein involved in Fe-S cluster formation